MAKRSPVSRKTSSGAAEEWVGGCISVALDSAAPGAGAELVIAAWCVADEALVLAHTIGPRDEAPALLMASYRQATTAPDVGPPHRPRRVRVETKDLAAALQPLRAERVEVVVGATPEIDRLAIALADLPPPDELLPGLRSADSDDGTYLDADPASRDAVEDLFEAAHLLKRGAPWRLDLPECFTRLDSAELHVAGAALMITRAALDSRDGFVILSDLEAVEKHVARSMAQRSPAAAAGRRPRSSGKHWVLSLELRSLDDLPPSARDEVQMHGWKAPKGGYPWLDVRGLDGRPLHATPQQRQLAATVAYTLGMHCTRAEKAFRDGEDGVTTEYDGEGISLRYTTPYETYDDFAAGVGRPVAHPSTAMLPPVPPASARPAAAPPAVELESGLEISEFLFRFAQQRFGAAFDRARHDFRDLHLGEQLLVEWSLFHHRIKGITFAEFLLADPMPGMPPRMRSFIDAQRQGWLSIWEVESIERGRHFTARDHLSGAVRRVEDVKASESLTPHAMVLGRIVEWDGKTQFWGVYAQPLPPHAGFPVVDALRRKLKIGRAGHAPLPLLRSDRTGRYMIAQWEQAIEELDAARRNPPHMVTAEGEPVILCTITYEFDAARRGDIAAALERMEAVTPPLESERKTPEWRYAILDPARAGDRALGPGNRMLGELLLRSRELELVTNARERCTRIEARLASAAGQWLREKGRREIDPRADYAARMEAAGEDKGARPGARLESVPPPEILQVMREHKEKHYRGWVEESIPALGGKTPRQAVRDAHGREQLDRLLRDMEYMESRAPEWERFDFGVIRRELGL